MPRTEPRELSVFFHDMIEPDFVTDAPSLIRAVAEQFGATRDQLVSACDLATILGRTLIGHELSTSDDWSVVRIVFS